AGFHEYVAKPFDPPSLVAAIARLARTRRRIRRGAPPRPGSIIMLVDDDPGTREYSCAVLKDCGYRVLAARGGEEALRVWAQHRDEIDLVVTDLMMPRTSGVDVYRTLREERADLPVIVVSGYPLVAEMLGARQEGVIECLEKPVAPEQLAASVRRALAREACAGCAPAASPTRATPYSRARAGDRPARERGPRPDRRGRRRARRGPARGAAP
ncbi:MAG TPA: response regulator, partial [Verrucomicrobiae bacterium]|nr:response regulator [Verrucomicrobiae bacterium]